jgi:arginase
MRAAVPSALAERDVGLDSPSVAVVGWPYHLGRSDVEMGSGPTALLADAQFQACVEEHAGDVVIDHVPAVDEALPEIARIFELDRRLAAAVAGAIGAGRFPLILAGNCISCLGTVAGVGVGVGDGGDGRRLGAVWLDAHADFDTPDDNLSGFSDVMALSILTGGSWRALRETIPGFRPIREEDVVMLGVRDLEPYQRQRLRRSPITVVGGRVDEHARDEALAALGCRVDGVYLHVDLDVLDTSVGTANRYAAPGGPRLGAVTDAIARVFATSPVRAASLTAYDPDHDPDLRILDAACRVAAAVIDGARTQARTAAEP